MQFNSATSKRGGGVGDGVVGAAHRLSFYETSPNAEVSLEDFEQFALDRLLVLKGFEEARAKSRRPDDLEPVALELWKKHMRTPNAAETSRKDVISHFVLRLAYCRTPDLRRWFLGMETALFRARFHAEATEAQRKFMEDQNLPYKAIRQAEFESVKEYLFQVARSLNQGLPNADSAFYKVPFEEVPELVSSRKVFLQQGFAFVPGEQLASMVAGLFRSRLSKALVLTDRLWTTTIASEEKDRLTPIVESLSMRYLGADYSQSTGKCDISLEDLDKLAESSFPLCMRHLFSRLRDDHHLKYWGRQQFGLFLKGIGLTLEDSLKFWRSAFASKIPAEKFDKDYAYNIRHNFGKEGKRSDYTPFSCMKIITSTPGVGDHHGCPYRHFSQDNLEVALRGLQVNGRAMDGIMDKVRNRHYQLACGSTFEAVHGCACDGINHPNQYFEQSRKVLQPEGNPDTPQLPANPSPQIPLIKQELAIPGSEF